MQMHFQSINTMIWCCLDLWMVQAARKASSGLSRDWCAHRPHRCAIDDGSSCAQCCSYSLRKYTGNISGWVVAILVTSLVFASKLLGSLLMFIPLVTKNGIGAA